jgi:hypothetical protein
MTGTKGAVSVLLFLVIIAVTAMHIKTFRYKALLLSVFFLVLIISALCFLRCVFTFGCGEDVVVMRMC